jgi:hypothetical protein
MKAIVEYSWKELEEEGLDFIFEGKKFTSLGGPEEGTSQDYLWSPAVDENGQPYDLTWIRRGIGYTESFVLDGYEKAGAIWFPGADQE